MWIQYGYIVTTCQEKSGCSKKPLNFFRKWNGTSDFGKLPWDSMRIRRYKMYSMRESELIQQYLQEHGKMPGGGEDDDLF